VVVVTCLDDALSEASLVEGQQLQQEDTKRRKKKGQKRK